MQLFFYSIEYFKFDEIDFVMPNFEEMTKYLCSRGFYLQKKIRLLN